MLPKWLCMVTPFKGPPIGYLIPIHIYETTFLEHKISKLDLNNLNCLDYCGEIIAMGPFCQEKRWLWTVTSLRVRAWDCWLGHICIDFLLNQMRSVIMVVSYRPTFSPIERLQILFARESSHVVQKRFIKSCLENFNDHIHYAYL